MANLEGLTIGPATVTDIPLEFDDVDVIDIPVEFLDIIVSDDLT